MTFHRHIIFNFDYARMIILLFDNAMLYYSLIKIFTVTGYFFQFQATGPFYNVNIMLIKKFFLAPAIIYFIIITTKHVVRIIQATLSLRKGFIVFQNFLFVTIHVFFISNSLFGVNVSVA